MTNMTPQAHGFNAGPWEKLDIYAAIWPSRGHSDAEKQSVEQARRLASLLAQQLSEPQVYRIGDTDKKVYGVGKTSQGDFAGVTTQVVES